MDDDLKLIIALAMLLGVVGIVAIVHMNNRQVVYVDRQQPMAEDELVPPAGPGTLSA